MPLNDTAIRNAKPGEKPIKMFDERGLFLIVTPAGGKWWRLRYNFAGKEKLLSLGTYPDVGLKDARTKRDEARKLLAQEIDPGEHRKATKAAKAERSANSFEVICREWLDSRKANVGAPQHTRALARMEKDVFPWLGAKPIRPSIGHRVVSIALETIRPLRILDFSWLADALDRRNQSYFQPDYMRVVERGVFLKHLSYLISQPVVPGKEYEYLITQAMGEYLAHVHPEPFDGVMFDSVQQQAGRNIVLFPDNSLLTAEVDELFGVKYVAGSVTLHAITGLSYSHEVEDVYVDNQGEVLALNGFDDHDHDYDYDEVEL